MFRPIFLHTLTDELTDIIDDFIIENPPEITVENDGIGSYEYWGQKCIDHGTDYFVIEDDEISIDIEHDYNQRTVKKIIADLLSLGYESGINTYDHRINFKVKDVYVKQSDVIRIEIQYTEVA